MKQNRAFRNFKVQRTIEIQMTTQDEKPDPKDNPWWKIVWEKVRIPQADANGYRHYKTVVNKTFIP